ncbi:MAG: apolipoprotein N-acyltransferase, partial [Desulfobulbaceae bacterium]|nr:apolipoprotein N-acyltransferase [Desulfobulbaceae bacterium]
PQTRKSLAVLSSGLLLFLATPGTPGLAPCAWMALVPLLWACRQEASVADAAWLGLGAGMVFYTLSLSWITIVLGTYGHLGWLVSSTALLLLALYMSLYLAIFAAGCRWSSPALPLTWIAPPLWVGLDLVRSRFLTGFPWLDLGYTQFRTPIILQTADLFGHHTVTFLIVMVNAMLAVLVGVAMEIWNPKPGAARGRRQQLLVAVLPAALLLLAAVAYGAIRQQQITQLCATAETRKIAVVQGNIPQDRKWSPSMQRETIASYLALSEEAVKGTRPPTLLIWPETALPFYPLESPLFIDVVDRLVKQHQVNLLTGAPHRQRPAPNAPPQYFNSAFLIAPADYPLSGMQLPLAKSPPMGRIIGRYDKQHLVPFGEYIPLRSVLPFLAPVVETLGDFDRGGVSGPISCQNSRIGVLICFESIFPDLARSHVAKGANLLVNLTNDAWFGRSNAPWQHLSMSVFRAVETRRSLARAANTGFSGCIDPLGNSSGLSELFTPASLTASLPLLTTETFFVRFGHHFATLCLMALVPAAIRVRRRG